jgi:hypothetical protein
MEKGFAPMKNAFPLLLASLLLMGILWAPAPGLALMALPDLGIDYGTMKVTQAAKLAEAGMTGVRSGDTVSLRLSPEEGRIYLKNLRTGEEIGYPPATTKGKGR